MRKTTIIALLLTTIGAVRAQHLEVASFTQDTRSTIVLDSIQRDFNGDPCGLIKATIPIDNPQFEGDIIAIKKVRGQSWIYMVDGSTWITIKSNKYPPLRYSFATPIKGGAIYNMHIRAEDPSAYTVRQIKKSLSWMLEKNDEFEHHYFDFGVGANFSTSMGTDSLPIGLNLSATYTYLPGQVGLGITIGQTLWFTGLDSNARITTSYNFFNNLYILLCPTLRLTTNGMDLQVFGGGGYDWSRRGGLLNVGLRTRFPITDEIKYSVSLSYLRGRGHQGFTLGMSCELSIGIGILVGIIYLAQSVGTSSQ